MSITLRLAQRYDIYRAVHKGLRLAHGRMLSRLGQADFTDAVEARRLLADLEQHLAHAASHLGHEEAHIHPALERRGPGATAALEERHRHHKTRLADLARLIDAVRAADGPARVHLGHDLYLGFSIFVGEDFAHMNEEETVTRGQLCALFTDDEQAAIEGGIIASLPPEENMAFMRMMLPAMTAAERLALMAGMKQGAPRDVLEAVLEQAARPSLAPRDFNVLLHDLGLAEAA